MTTTSQMKGRLNIKAFNIILIISFIIIGISSLIFDLNRIEDPIYLILIQPTVFNIIPTILDIFVSILFFYMAYKYNQIRKTKKDRYLSTLIFYSAIYLGFSWLSELFLLNFDSNIKLLSDVGGKFYLPLSIVSTLFFVFMAFEVFIIPILDQDAHTATKRYLIIICANVGLVIGDLTLIFYYTPDLSLFELITGLSGAGLSAVLIFIVLLTVYRINTIRKDKQIAGRKPIMYISIQLVLLIPMVLFTVLIDLDAVVGFGEIILFLFRIIRIISVAGIAILYQFSFINPSGVK
jgi:hypothetical protein